LGLALLRAEFLLNYGASQFWVESAGGKIDCAAIPPSDAAYAHADAFNGFDGAAQSRLPKRPAAVPTVLFCAPNAVLYESFGLSPKNGHGWVATYASLGFQVVVWNARGYGRSSGFPSPRANADDAKSIVEFLRNTCNVPTLVLHGESIGGMAACAVAAQLAGKKCAVSAAGRKRQEGSAEGPMVDVLVADRTFANLRVEAQYLTGFSATSWLLPLFTLWTEADTDSVGNFATATCPKLCASDANDHMIPEPASLKAGLAILVELGDSTLRQKTFAAEDIASAAMSQLPKCVSDVYLAIDDAAGGPWRLSDEGITHFAHSVRFVAAAAADGTFEHSFVKKSRSKKVVQRGIDASLLGRQLAALGAWRVLSRVDGGCGVPLRTAAAADLGAMRCWCCSAAAWPDSSKHKLLDGPPASGSGDDSDDADDADDAAEAPLQVAAAAELLRRTVEAYSDELQSRDSHLAHAVGCALRFLEGLARASVFLQEPLK
jgi:pimeloyl-ACP methyl ester carboxylesterase